ncbi:serine/threonine protein phosphatase [Bradyrhizobium diazoefficiens]|uniref:metallophosphoesterase family protein n=1 Tax=Bradyrhizobium diazoefficiens TaxID=1355477 RepID=UPI001B8D0E32|nr:metallophosphoesterase family protein [Bradyrhizobium diazoefficiens]MBR0860672.1 serine/threonine protein phosphatase [Bradyrhizobium diazoefficiens]MBR0885163.1 serine/threonine protein phosphatase [Bradyrhizobium diazoefficiens]MBR0916758.1 serine/threonine protein phosphatase [Bradyrhizobium diazoefficiens]
MSKTYALGDVHGCLDQLQRLVELCERDAGEGRSKLVFLGDYIDRGPDSRGVIEFLMDLQKWSPDEIICLRGNHEDLLLAALEGEDAELNWRQNGAQSTLNSYNARSPRDIPLKHIDWIRSLPLFHDDGMRFFVHAGVHPDKPLDQQRRRDLLWIREPFLSSNKDFGRLIVHGHTPIPSGNPDQRANRLNIETGAIYGRALTAAIFVDRAAAPIRFLSARPIRD